jgi:hypothetical protein
MIRAKLSERSRRRAARRSLTTESRIGVIFWVMA